MVSYDKLKIIPGETTIFLHEKFIFLRDITFMSHWRLCYTMTAKQVYAAAIEVFVV